MTPRPPSPWFFPRKPSDGRRPRLFCFHNAGGSGAEFWALAALLPDVEVIALQLPSDWQRPAPVAEGRMERLLDALEAELAPWLDEVPYAFLGYSFGSILAYELTCRSVAAGRATPTELYLAAMMPPHRFRETATPGDAARSEEELLAMLDSHFGIRIPDAPAMAGLRALTILVSRAYGQLHESYEPRERSPLPVPITVLRGTEDRWVTAGAAPEWQRYTCCPLRLHELDGPHLFLQTRAADVAAILRGRPASPTMTMTMTMKESYP